MHNVGPVPKGTYIRGRYILGRGSFKFDQLHFGAPFALVVENAKRSYVIRYLW